MFGTTWLNYFEGNSRRDCAPAASLRAEVPQALHGPLALSLGRFQLGESYQECAVVMSVSTNTVRSFVREIYRKLHVRSKTAAVLRAIELGLLRRP